VRVQHEPLQSASHPALTLFIFRLCIRCWYCGVYRLDVSYNKLTGTIATELGLMSALYTIDAMGNLLTGTIPNEMMGMNPNLRLNFTDNL
jgi:hypothetical protein